MAHGSSALSLINRTPSTVSSSGTSACSRTRRRRETRKVLVATGLAGLGISLMPRRGPLVAVAGWQTHDLLVHRDSRPRTGERLPHRSGRVPERPDDPPGHAARLRIGGSGGGPPGEGITMHAGVGIRELPKQPQEPWCLRQRPVDWGDPYAAFVGNVDGSETRYTGYGVYYPPIAAAPSAPVRPSWPPDRLDDEPDRVPDPAWVIPWSSGSTSTSPSRAPARGAHGTVGSCPTQPRSTRSRSSASTPWPGRSRHRCRGRPAQDHLDGGVHRGDRDLRGHGRRSLVGPGDRRLRVATHVRRGPSGACTRNRVASSRRRVHPVLGPIPARKCRWSPGDRVRPARVRPVDPRSRAHHRDVR